MLLVTRTDMRLVTQPDMRLATRPDMMLVQQNNNSSSSDGVFKTESNVETESELSNENDIEV